MAADTLGIALLGHGTVGSGVVEILTSQRGLLRQRTGVAFDLRHVAVRDPAKHAAAGALPFTRDFHRAIDDPEVKVVVEVMGGLSPAEELVARALKAGKAVVTANKALLAARGADLFALARRHGTLIAFEASVGGGIPIIDALARGLAANRIDALLGIVNGTCNFILSQMTNNGWGYDQALKEAQAQGFAEADPTMDVSGRDSAQKLAILAGLAFNCRVEEGDIHLQGIDTLDARDIRFAGDLGYVIKLLAIAQRHAADAVSLRVHPTLVHREDMLAKISGSFNAVSLYGHALGHTLFYGRGAGKLPTASAVVSDLIAVALGSARLTFDRLAIYPDRTPRAAVRPFHEIASRYYVRLAAKDQPGVMAAVSKILGDQAISLSAILQPESPTGATADGSIPIVVTTHLANEGAMQAALAQLGGLPVITAPPVCLRIVDQPKEFA